MVAAANNSGGSFLRELKRRNVVRSALIYVACCALVLVLVRMFAPGAGAQSASAFQVVLYLAVLGLPLLLLMAWHFQLTRRGMLRATSFVERRVLRNLAPINDRRHARAADDSAPAAAAGEHRWRISAETGSLMGLTYSVPASLTLGSAADCDISVLSDFVSPRHARLDSSGGELTLEDLGSASGTVVNGRPVRGKQPLHHEDELRLHDIVFRVSDSTLGDPASVQSAD
jgi:hypothetical protein